jgi:hypothetical protein
VNFHCAIVLMMVKMTQMKKQMKMAVVMIKWWKLRYMYWCWTLIIMGGPQVSHVIQISALDRDSQRTDHHSSGNLLHQRICMELTRLTRSETYRPISMANKKLDPSCSNLWQYIYSDWLGLANFNAVDQAGSLSFTPLPIQILCVYLSIT